MSDLAHERVVPLLRGTFGRPYLYAAESASTQDALRDGDHPQGAVAVAEHQTAGRGRSGRRWEDVSRAALLFSVVLEPPGAASLPQLSLVAGLAVAVAVERETGLGTQIKWPNDVLVDGGKVAGILLEASGGAVVCGIGINVNQEVGELPRETRVPATSLRIASGRSFDRAACSRRCSSELEGRYRQWLADGLAGLRTSSSDATPSGVSASTAGGRSGTAGAIAPDGRLAVAVDAADSLLVESGEVVVRVPG